MFTLLMEDGNTIINADLNTLTCTKLGVSLEPFMQEAAAKNKTANIQKYVHTTKNIITVNGETVANFYTHLS